VLRNNSSSSGNSSDMTMTAPACRDDVDYTLAHCNRLGEQQQQQKQNSSSSSKQPDKQVGRVISS